MTTIDHLAAMCQELKLHAERSDGNLIVPMTRAEDPERPIYNVFYEQEGRVVATAFATGFLFPQDDPQLFDAYEFCNRWNSDYPAPRACVAGDGSLCVEMNYYREGLSDEYLKENFLRLFIRLSGDFFEAAGERW